MSARKTKPNRSGTQWTEADYAEHGYERVTMRLPADAAKDLKALAKRDNASRTEVVTELIRAAASKRK